MDSPWTGIILPLWRMLLSSSVLDKVGSTFSISEETINKLNKSAERASDKLDIFILSAVFVLARVIDNRYHTEFSTDHPASGLGISVGDCVTQAIELTVADDPDLKLENHDEREFGDGAIWHEVLQDCLATETGSKINFTKLWSEKPSRRLEQDWKLTFFNWPDHWSKFWLRWYQSALDGTPLNPDLLRDIALIPDEDWKKGEGHIAGLIAEIELRYAIKATPNAEVIVINPATGLLRVETVSHLSSNRRADVVDTLRDATAIFDQGNSGNQAYAMLFPERDLVLDGCNRYANRPIMLLRVCRRVVARVIAKEAAGECPKNDSLVADFVGSVAGAAGDLMAFDSDVKEAETARLASAPVVVSAEVGRDIIIAADASAKIAEGDLKLELPVDAAAITSGSTEVERQIALYQTKSRLLRVFDIVKNAGKSSVDHLNKHAGVYGLILTIVGILMV